MKTVIKLSGFLRDAWRGAKYSRDKQWIMKMAEILSEYEEQGSCKDCAEWFCEELINKVNDER